MVFNLVYIFSWLRAWTHIKKLQTNYKLKDSNLSSKTGKALQFFSPPETSRSFANISEKLQTDICYYSLSRAFRRKAPRKLKISPPLPASPPPPLASPMTPSHGAAAAAASSSAGAGRRAATFAGASVFLSRSLVAPEVYDAVHDALRLNGAEVFLCADPARTGPLDFHVISSSSHVREPSSSPTPPHPRDDAAGSFVPQNPNKMLASDLLPSFAGEVRGSESQRLQFTR